MFNVWQLKSPCYFIDNLLDKEKVSVKINLKRRINLKCCQLFKVQLTPIYIITYNSVQHIPLHFAKSFISEKELHCQRS